MSSSQSAACCAASCDPVLLQVERYGLDRLLMKGTVDSITPVLTEEEEEEEEHEEAGTVGASDGERDGRGSGRRRTRRRKRVEYFQVLLQGGVTLEARQVVVATGPTRAQMANVPAWVERISEDYPEERLQHTVSLMHHLASTRCHAGEWGGGRSFCDRHPNRSVSGFPGVTGAHVCLRVLRAAPGAGPGVRGGPEADGDWRRSDQRSHRVPRPAARRQSCDLGDEEAPAGGL